MNTYMLYNIELGPNITTFYPSIVFYNNAVQVSKTKSLKNIPLVGIFHHLLSR